MAKYDASCILSLKNLEESEITYITQRIDEFVKGASVPYWWIHRPAFYIVVGILLYGIVSGVYFLSIDREKWAEKANNVAVLSGWSVICMAISAFLIKGIIEYLFPEGGFAIGEQIKYMKKKDKVRGLIFITIIGSIVIGVISGVLTHFIVG
jgi:hypothetical protein